MAAADDRRAYEREATKVARANHADAPHGTFAARVRAEVSCAMQAYDVAAYRARPAGEMDLGLTAADCERARRRQNVAARIAACRVTS